MTRSLLHFLVFLNLLASGCAHRVFWTERIAPGCTTRSGDAALDREQTYLALLLALKDLRYAIVRTEPGQAVDASFAGDYRPDQVPTEWQIRVLADGAFSVDAPSTRREMHARSPARYTQLVQYQAQYRCRSLDWLRWETQNHGLSPVGPTGTAAADTAESASVAPSAGGESERVTRQLRMAALIDQRAQIRLRRPSIYAGAGVFLTLVGASTLVNGFIPRSCEIAQEDCDQLDRSLKIVGGSMLAAGALTLGVALPITLRRFRAFRELGRELKMLRSTQLTLDPGPLGLGLRLSGSF